MKKNITCIISDIDKALAFEWAAEFLDKEKITLSFILINGENSFLRNYLQEKHIPVYAINCKSKKNIPLAVWKCFWLLKKLNPDVVHCHLFFANLIGLTAAKMAGIKSRIYTRHHSDYHHVYFPKTVKWDKYCNSLATKIVSISDVVTNILVQKENVEENKIVKIHHGFDTKSFIEPNEEKVTALNAKYNPQNKKPVIGVISRFTEWKGVQYIIPAGKKLLEKYPDALLLLFNANGDYEKEIDVLLKELPQYSFQKIKFENDIANLYKVFDVFVHVPISENAEAFGQTYIETMLSSIPLVATKSGIGNEIMKHEFNCLEVPYQNSEAIYNAILQLLENETLKNELIKNARQSVEENFSINKMITSLEQLYLH
ncbi:MAG: glycosyltransferase family 4 protein [Bacteroidetes bacterium]|nr:glycosyltransferase family 4 protein [Bacteroidota bacterium]